MTSTTPLTLSCFPLRCAVASHSVTLRPWRSGDQDSLVEHANNVKVWRNLRDAFPHPYTRADADEWIKRVAWEPRVTSGHDPVSQSVTADAGTHPKCLAICINDIAVGGIGIIAHADIERVSAEMGYWLSEKYWGVGITTEAVRGFVAYVFDRFPAIHRVYATPFAHNIASRRVLETNGFSLEGIMRQCAIKEGKLLDMPMYSFLRTDVGTMKDRKCNAATHSTQ